MKTTYKVLISEKSYLKVKLRAMRLSGTFIDEIFYNKKDLLFRTRSGTDPRLTWFQTIRITDLEKLDEISRTKDLDRVIRESGIKVHCTCIKRGNKVKIRKGYKSIEKITEVDEVLTSQGTYQRVAKVLTSRHKKWIRLGLSNGKTLEVTENHKIKKMTDVKLIWVSAGSLKLGDSLASPKPITHLLSKSISRYDCNGIKIISIDIVEGDDYFYDICLFNEPHDYICQDVLVSNCPAFLYWGFKYMAWKNGYGLERETRVPRVRNPHQQGYVCKHIYQCCMVYPFISKTVAMKMRKYFKPIDDKKEEERLKEEARINKEKDESER